MKGYAMVFNPTQLRDERGRWTGGNYAKAVAALSPSEHAALHGALQGRALGRAVRTDLARRGPGLVTSLESQIGRRPGMTSISAHQLAVEILTKQGSLDSSGKL